MRLVYVGLLVSIFSNQIAQEKDYSVFDYNALMSEHQWRVFDTEKKRVEKASPKKDARPYLVLAQVSPGHAIESVLSALKSARLDYTPDKKLQAYQIAQNAMLMAQVVDVICPEYISKSVIHRAWRSNNKDVSRMLALCRKHPESAHRIIENFKRDVRYQLTKKLAQ